MELTQLRYLRKLSITTTPFTLQIQNGMGQGYGGSWSASGSQSITYPGVGEIAVDHSFTVATK